MIKLRPLGSSTVGWTQPAVILQPPSTATQWPGKQVTYVLPPEGTFAASRKLTLERPVTVTAPPTTLVSIFDSYSPSRDGFAREESISMGIKPRIQTPSDMQVAVAEEPTSDLDTADVAMGMEGVALETSEAEEQATLEAGVDVGTQEFGEEKKTNWWLWGGLAIGAAVLAGGGYLLYRATKKGKKE